MALIQLLHCTVKMENVLGSLGVNQIALTSWRKIVLLELKFMSQTISNNRRFLMFENRTHQ